MHRQWCLWRRLRTCDTQHQHTLNNAAFGSVCVHSGGCKETPLMLRLLRCIFAIVYASPPILFIFTPWNPIYFFSFFCFFLRLLVLNYVTISLVGFDVLAVGIHVDSLLNVSRSLATTREDEIGAIAVYLLWGVVYAAPRLVLVTRDFILICSGARWSHVKFSALLHG